MVVWLKLEDGEAVRLVDRWSPSIFVGADSEADFAVPLHTVRQDYQWARPVHMRERVTDPKTSEVLEMKLNDATKAQQVAGRIERLGPFGTFRLYNADIPPPQGYLYEKDLFPLARCDVEAREGQLQWRLEDNVWDYEYAVPGLRKVKLDVEVAKEGKLPRFTDRLESVTLESDSGKITIDGGSETDKLLTLVQIIGDTDPDFVLTNDGDTFLFPYLIRRAQANGLTSQLVLDRDRTTMKASTKEGTSYFSYGRIHYKPSAIKLRGRVHIDTNTSLIYSEAGFEGLFELSRVCRMPLHTSSRASIGKALSSLQFYHAHRTGLLVPWKPTLVERFKDRNELMVADRGGFIFEPRLGVCENIGELDFSALYPNIMHRKNISAETVKCPCCPDSDNRVPELGWNVCKAKGIVPLAIEIIVEKRLRYKKLKTNTTNEADRRRYNARQAALKWLGVTTFGYLGFNNAKFGRIDAHIAVCAWDRKILLDAARIAEERGFEVMHGIVDSLWVKKEGADRKDYLELKAGIESETGFAMTFEGIYKWLAFLPSKADPRVPVLNRYFGAYEDGSLKVRGMEARRHDTPFAFKRCQMDLLKIMARAGSAAEVRDVVPECIEAFFGYADMIRRHELSVSELAYTANLSKAPDEYMTMTVQNSAVTQLTREGASLHSGEGIRYVITDYDGGDSKRAAPLDMVEDQSKYDAERYIRLLARACSSVLEPFAPECTAQALERRYEAHRSGSLTS